MDSTSPEDREQLGLQTANSWTRDNTIGNNFLGNSATELNTLTQLYDLDYRNYDPILGRMHQVDPLADNYGSWSTYKYAYNSPVNWNDPSGAADAAGSAGGGFENADKYMNRMNSPERMYGVVGDDDTYGNGFVKQTPVNSLNEAYFNQMVSDLHPAKGGDAGKGPGPQVFNKWCGCMVNAFEVIEQNPNNQNEAYRAKARAAIDRYLNQNNASEIDKRAMNFLLNSAGGINSVSSLGFSIASSEIENGLVYSTKRTGNLIKFVGGAGTASISVALSAASLITLEKVEPHDHAQFFGRLIITGVAFIPRVGPIILWDFQSQIQPAHLIVHLVSLVRRREE